MTTYLRADRAVFRFSGPDAHQLLNDVITGHVPTEDEVASWWALLTPQGKILAEGLIGRAEDALWLDVHSSVAADFLRRMKMYRLRASVVIDDLRETHRVGWTVDQQPATGIVHTDRYGPLDIGWRIIAPLAGAESWEADDPEYARTRIGAGLSELGQDFQPDSTFAHDIGMDILDGIDFEKGCYVGQEVVSRMKHRGTARRRPVVVHGVGDDASGASVMAGEREAGTLGRVVDGVGVAILRLDRITGVAAATVAGKAVELELPVWATYGFGESVSDD